MTCVEQCNTAYVQFIVICPLLFKAEKEKANPAPLSASKDKGGAKIPDKKGRNQPSPVEPYRERKTKLKRRDHVELPKFKGKTQI